MHWKDGSVIHQFTSRDSPLSLLVLQKVIPVTSAARVYTGPRVQGSHPVLVSFESHSDR